MHHPCSAKKIVGLRHKAANPAFERRIFRRYSNSNSKRSLRWLIEGSSTFPLSISLPEGERTLFTLSLRERVAEGRVRASVAFFLAALISSLI
jgi:hypothetical protein